MDKIIFVDYETHICSLWLNTVSDTVWDALGQAKTPLEARQFIGAVEEAPDDGKSYLRAGLGWSEAATSLAHNDLGGRSVPDGHPTSAITGLDSALAGKSSVGHTHDGSEISGITADQVSFTPTTGISATDVQEAVAELESDVDTKLAGKQPNLPSQTGQSGQFLTTDGTNLDWAEVDALPDQFGHSGEFLTTDGSNPSWVPAQANLTGFGLFEHASTISADYAIATGNNAISGGPVTIDSGVTVTVPSGSVWSIA